MGSPEIKKDLELPKNIDKWIAQIESNWRFIPEFKVDSKKFKHLAIICDGNRRAAQERNFPPHLGHQASSETIILAARAARKWDIPNLTFWVWSTENWERDKIQVGFIMNLLQKNLQNDKLLQELRDDEVQFVHLGRKDRLPSMMRKGLESWEKKTAHFNRYRLNLGIDYGGEDEIARAIAQISLEVKQGRLSPEKITKNPKLISKFLDTKNQPPVDLIIRTGTRSDEIPHTSGFMPLQSAYASWAFIPDFFPNLTPNSLLNPIKEFQEYQRRFGK